MAHLSTKQIKQLIEIDNAGKGIKDEVQALIARLTSGGVGVKTDDPREAQAKRLYNNGIGFEATFEKYLECIPPIPEFPPSYVERFPELVLVDTRVPVFRFSRLFGIEFSGDNETYVDFDPKTAKTDKVYWIRAQDGRKNSGKSVETCRKSFAEDEVGLSVYEGLALFVQNPNRLKGRVMDLPGSVHREDRGDRGYAAYLGGFDARPKLCWDHDGRKYQLSGSASRGK